MQYTGINIILWSNIRKKINLKLEKKLILQVFNFKGQKSQKTRNLILAKCNTFKV